MIFTQLNHIIPVKAPIADAFAGTLNTDVISLKNASHLTFLMWWGVGATGTTLVTVDACDDVSPSNTTKIAFRYKVLAAAAQPATEDTWGALQDATTAGFTTSAGSFRLHAIEIEASAVQSAGYGFARLTCVEAVSSPCLGGVLAILSKLRHQGDTLIESIS